MTVEGLYNLKLLDYKINGYRDYPDKLLALLLLSEKDEYEPLRVSEGDFYNTYKEKIDQKIAKVEKDFEITNDDIVSYIEAKGLCCEDFDRDRIWYVYHEGFGSMHWGIWYHPELTAEEIYEECFEDPGKYKNSEVAKRYKNLISACQKYVKDYEERQLAENASSKNNREILKSKLNIKKKEGK